MAHPTGELTVDLRAIADNWKLLNSRLASGVECGAVVKANAYGLGVDRVAPKIYAAGCRSFFVANLKEAMQLQSVVGRDARVFVLSGCIAGAEKAFIARGLIPVIVSMDMLKRWAAACDGNVASGSVLKVDSGMARLGLEVSEFDALLADIPLLKKAGVNMLMSHLACADEQGHSLTGVQLERFSAMLSSLQAAGMDVEATLANSAGVYLGAAAHHQLVRPGIALYGGNPGCGDNPMTPVVGLRLPIIQVRRLPAGEFVGYGATKVFDNTRTIAVVAGGYADGILRSLSNRGWGVMSGVKVPIVGRVSMDSTIFDVTDVPGAEVLSEGDAIELLGPNVSIDDLAVAAGTISYEILTALGDRYQRCYMG